MCKIAAIAGMAVLLSLMAVRSAGATDQEALLYKRQKIAEVDEGKLKKLAKEMRIEEFDRAIKTGDQKIYALLPSKGYPNGFAGLLKRYRLVVNPEHSFTDCEYNSRVYKAPTSYAQGCRVSLKLARIQGGRLEDAGIRVEWARDLHEKNLSA